MGLNQPISLVHIGMVKTATTALQNLWLNSSKTCLVHQGALNLVNKARVTGRNITAGNAIPLQWKYDNNPLEGQQIVVSQEALSTAYINERATAADIKRFQLSAATMTAKLFPDTKILITVRQPEAIIKSIYNQAVKQGGVDTFPWFLQNEADFIAQTLNLLDLVKFWANFYGRDNILVLPVELFRENRAAFFDVIEDFSGLPSPGQIQDKKINLSLKPEHLKLMRKFNEWVAVFSQYGIYGKNIPAQVTQALNTIRFAVRYSLESPSRELEERLADVEKQLEDCRVDLSLLDQNFVTKIKDKFSQVIGDDDFYGYRSLYTD